MKKVFIFTAAVITILLVNCSKDEVVTPMEYEKNKGTVINLTASMPGKEDPSYTRIALEQEGLNIKLTWEAGDKIYFVFAEGGIAKGKYEVTLAEGDITNEGKKSTFDVIIPPEITSETFDLYGVFGVTGFAGEESSDILLTGIPWSESSLTDVQDKDVLMLRFAETGISRTSLNTTVTFEHVGSLFRILLNNNSEIDLNGINKVELISGSKIPAIQSSGTTNYNLITNAFTGTVATDTALPFEITETNLNAGNILEFWGWYPPIADQNWPGLGLRISTTEGTYTSNNAKPPRLSPTAAGKAYHFFASFDGTTLQFTNSNGIADTDYIFDSRDNNIYKTVNLGTQTWMAENLAYLPAVSSLPVYSDTEPHYYVFGYNGPDITTAKTTAYYRIYGVAYNWPAAMEGAAPSKANPSGVKGVCPTGWHLPSELEWLELENYLTDNGYNYDGSIGGTGTKIAKSMASAADWGISTVVGAVGNTDYAEYRNKSGFTALPGGYFTGSNFFAIGSLSKWWSTSTDMFREVACRSVESYSATLYWVTDDKFIGNSVRCVRN